MTLEMQVAAAFALDLALGDPRGLPHPVRLIGAFAGALEAPLRARTGARTAGVCAALIVVCATGAAALGLLAAARSLHPLAGDVVAILILYTTLATRDLLDHASDVWRALREGDLGQARVRVGRMVGRDTRDLDEAGVSRATVESVAENLVDGVTAPLFFAVVAGPVGALCFKAVSTLDSMFGYKNDRYLHFGCASARLDDVASYLPARLTAPLVAVAAAVLGLDARGSLRVLRRDGRNHASPNSGLAEAAFAGALGVRLGGPGSYFGRLVDKPTLGDARVPLDPSHIPSACSLMLVSAFLAAFAFVALRLTLLGGLS